MTKQEAMAIARRVVAGLQHASGSKVRVEAWNARDHAGELEAARTLCGYDIAPIVAAGRLRCHEGRGNEFWGLLLFAYQQEA